MEQSIGMTDLSKLTSLYSSHFEKANLYNVLVFVDKWAFKSVCKQQRRPGLWAEPLVPNGQLLSERSVIVLCRS